MPLAEKWSHCEFVFRKVCSHWRESSWRLLCQVRNTNTHRFMQGSMDSKVSLSHLIHYYVLAPSRLKHAFRQNAGHYECSADFMNNDDHRWVL